MTPRDPTWIRRAAKRAGWLYLAIVPFAVFGLLYVPSSVVVPGDATATAENVMASEWLFRSGIVSHLVSEVLFVFLALALYRLLVLVDERLAVAMVALALVSVPIALLGEVEHLAVLGSLGGAESLQPLTASEVQAQAMLLLDRSNDATLVAQLFWGLWLFPLGVLVYRSGFLPRVLGVLLLVAGFGYVFDVVSAILFPDAGVSIASFTFVGELLLALWLAIKGVDVQQWQEVARAGQAKQAGNF